jgi:hypothetical protein
MAFIEQKFKNCLLIAVLTLVCSQAIVSASNTAGTASTGSTTSQNYQANKSNNTNTQTSNSSQSKSSAQSSALSGALLNGLNNSISTGQSVANSVSGAASSASAATSSGASLNTMADQYLQQHPDAAWLKAFDIRDANNNPIPGLVNPATVPGASPFGTYYPPTPAAAMAFTTRDQGTAAMINYNLRVNPFTGQRNSDLKNYLQATQGGLVSAYMQQYPKNVANQARAQAVGQSQAMSNAMGDVSKSQAASAITYCSSYLQNFTVDDGNRWNKIRNGIFVPIAILLLLPGAVMTQFRAMVIQGNPVLSDPTQGDINPFEGILRSVIAVFLIPATYLVVNYGIDFSNCIVDAIAGTYQNVMGTNMYQDALGSEANAFPVRTPKENQNAGAPQPWPTGIISGLSDFERLYLRNKDGNNAPPNQTDEAMPAGAVAARQISFGANAAMTAGWNVLCAFQMVYLCYLYFVGPIAAALWVWPMAALRAAFPSWVEGVITICFWSLFWNTTILLMACFNGNDQSSTMITSALNFLATSCVRFAFDFAGLVQAAGTQAATQATQSSGAGGSKAGAGSKGSQGRSGSAAGSGRGAVGAGAGGQGGSGQGAGTDVVNGGDAGGDPVAPGQPAEQQASLTTSASLVPSNGALVAGFATNGGLPLPVPLPPSAPPPPNAIRSQTVSLGGNYTLSRVLDPQGRPSDVLMSNGQVIANLPIDTPVSAPVGVTPVNGGPNGISFLRGPATNAGVQYAFTGLPGVNGVVSATMPPADQLAPGATLGGALSPNGDPRNDSIALRSINGNGTFLLEDGGNTLLVPQKNNPNEYDSFQIQTGPGAKNDFTLSDGRTLSLTHPDGSPTTTTIAVHARDGNSGNSEQFTVSPAAVRGGRGYNVSHEMNGQRDGNSVVSTNGVTTTYARSNADGIMTEKDQLTGNNLVSTLYHTDGSLQGSVNTTYETNGNSESQYFQPDGTLSASSTHMFKPEGGFVDTVRNSQGEIVSVQETGAVANAAYNYESPNQNFYDMSSPDNVSLQPSAEPVSLLRPSAELLSSLQHSAEPVSSMQHSAEPASLLRPSAELLSSLQPSAEPQIQSYQRTSYILADQSNEQPHYTEALSASAAPVVTAQNQVNPIQRPSLNNQTNNQTHHQTINSDRLRSIADVLAASTIAKVVHLDQSEQRRSEPLNVARSSSPAEEHNDSGYARNRTIGEVLGTTRTASESSNAANSPAADDNSTYDMLCSLLRQGLIQQARLLLPIVQHDLNVLRSQGKATNAVNIYVQLLTHHKMFEEAALIQRYAAPLALNQH